MNLTRLAVAALLLMAMVAIPNLPAQQAAAPHPPFTDRATSEISLTARDTEEMVEITNNSYEVSGTQVPGRSPEDRLVIRKKIRTRQVLDEIGIEARTTVEAWPLGTSLVEKPLYTINVAGVDAQTVDGELLVVSRGLEEVDWWSVYKLGTGEHLFDTYIPLVQFSISRETVKLRYVGLEVPPDDTADTRLKDPHVVGVITYASAEHVIREALLTCNDSGKAAMFRSFSDATRTVTVSDSSRFIKISFSRNFPSAPATQSVVIPIAKDDLDLTHVQMPAHLHVAAWKRHANIVVP